MAKLVADFLLEQWLSPHNVNISNDTFLGRQALSIWFKSLPYPFSAFVPVLNFVNTDGQEAILFSLRTCVFCECVYKSLFLFTVWIVSHLINELKQR